MTRSKAKEYLDEWLRYSKHTLEESLYTEIIDLLVYVVEEEI